MLTPASIPFIVFTVPPLLLVIVILFTRPSIRRLIGGLLGGCAFAVFHVAWDTVAHYTGWWRYPFTTEAHAPFLWYAGSVFWGASTALIGWRVQRRFGMRGLFLFLVIIGVLGAVNDFTSVAVTQASNLIIFGAGVVPVLADIACSGSNALVAQVAMRLVAGPIGGSSEQKAVRLIILMLVYSLLFFVGAFVWLRLSRPSDNARLEPVQPIWRDGGGGVVVSPLQKEADGLQQGDIVIAIAGRSTEAWIKMLFEPGTPRPAWQNGQTITYTVMRDGHSLDVSVRLSSYSFGAMLMNEWGVLLLSLLFEVVGMFIFLRRHTDRAAGVLFFSWSCLVAGAIAWSLGQQGTDIVDGFSFWLYRGILRTSYVLGWVGVLHLTLIFPLPYSALVRYPKIIWFVYAVPCLLMVLYIMLLWWGRVSPLQWLGWIYPAERLLTIGCLFLILVVLIQSYRRARQETTVRLQIRWIVFAFVMAEGLTLLLGFLPELIIGHPLLDWNILVLLFLPTPLAFAVAILRYRLFDIDLIINRTLVYIALTSSIVGVYILTVGLLSTVFQLRGDLFVSLFATGLVAILFNPLRNRLQHIVNHLMYGERDDPYRVLSRLSQRLRTIVAPDAMLPTIVETVALALKLPYAAIALKRDDSFTIVACYGRRPEGELLVLPLLSQREIIGQLLLAARAPGELFSPADQRLLEDIAQQTGVIAHAMRLTADLQRSRERLVTAREEERRRLRRDLHDGLGPALATLMLTIDAARNQLTRNLAAADRLLVELKEETQEALTDIRRLVYELRPPALDELGLISALREQTTHYTLNDLQVALHAPDILPPLPAAIEVAVYRIALEALTNVSRHAHARTCSITISLTNALNLEIMDDGCGLPEEYHTGVGITSMRERAAELGGNCVIESNHMQAGTRVYASLPLPKE